MDVDGYDKMLSLWTVYNKQLLKFWKDSPFPLINFDMPREKYAEDLGAICDYLDLKRPADSQPFFDVSIRNHPCDLSSLSGDAQDVYEALMECWRSEINPIRHIYAGDMASG